MRVIKQGKLPENKLYAAACRNCKTEVEFNEGEAERRFHRNETHLVVDCPLCKEPITKEIG